MKKILIFFKIVLNLMPVWLALAFGRFIGFIIYLNPKKRRDAFKNLKSAFPDTPNKKLMSIWRKACGNIGLSLVESFIASKLVKKVKINGLENISPDGCILVAIHESNWELGNFALAARLPYAILVKQQKEKALDQFLNDLRSAFGLKVCYSLKELIKYIHQNHNIGLMFDHGAEDNASFVDFFSHLVPTPGGAVYLARKFNKKICPATGVRVKGVLTIDIAKPIDPNQKSPEDILGDINKYFEDFLRKNPEYYLWDFKRFKRKKDRDILILSDGKAGHLKQSKALVSFIKEANPFVRAKVIDVRYRGFLAKLVSEVCAFFSGKHCLGCGRCLFFLLNKETLKSLNSSYADIVVSAGSYVAPVNKIFSSYMGAKAVSILRPNIVLRKFDLCLIPEHDRIYGDNILKIKGALFYPEAIDEKVKECAGFFKFSDKPKVSLFVGAALRYSQDFFENLKVFLPKLKAFCKAKGYKLLISTSRRTPLDVVDYIEKELKGFDQLEAVVYANRDNYNFVFEGFVGASDMVFVTSESISMLAEAASLKKPCIAVFLERPDGKHSVFLQSIEQDVGMLKSPLNWKS